jgi:hypothetical protein
MNTDQVDTSGTARPARAWVSRATIDAKGRRLDGLATSDGVTVITVCVDQAYDTAREARLELMGAVARRGRARGWVAAGAPTLWVFPGGYFGFDASKSRGPKSGGRGLASQKRRNAWPGIIAEEALVLERRLDVVRKEFPVGSQIAIGVDQSRERQGAWVLRDDGSGRMLKDEIVRGLTPLDGRKFVIGSLKAAFFVCGEMTGSRTEGGGPFHDDELLTNPTHQLKDCGLLVDLAHLRIPGAISAPRPNPRWVHQRQMERFARSGAGVLAHHHGGLVVGKHARFEHQSSWIIFRGGQWLTILWKTCPESIKSSPSGPGYHLRS